MSRIRTINRGISVNTPQSGIRRVGGNTPYRFGSGGRVGGAGGGGGGGTGGPPRGPGRSGDRPGYPLAGLLFCATCQLPLSPKEMLGGRAYGSPCGCRLTVVAADVLERLVLDAVQAREPTARVKADTDDAGRVFRQFLAEVRLGGDLDDLRIVWRT